MICTVYFSLLLVWLFMLCPKHTELIEQCTNLLIWSTDQPTNRKGNQFVHSTTENTSYTSTEMLFTAH